jgi:hypothetical protein
MKDFTNDISKVENSLQTLLILITQEQIHGLPS